MRRFERLWRQHGYRTMTRKRFLGLPQRDKDTWTELLKHEGYALDRVVKFDHVGPLILHVTVYQRDASGKVAVHKCAEPGCDFGPHAGISERRIFDVATALR